MDMSRTILVLGLGSNINPLFYLRRALQLLKKSSVFEFNTVSRIYESEAQTKSFAETPRNDYLNAAVLVRTKLNDPTAWLRECQRIERELGRPTGVSRGVWQDRTIDIDILYSSLGPFNTPELTIPHPRLFERPFALLPLLEVYERWSKAADQQFKLKNDIKDIRWIKPWVNDKPFKTCVSKRYFWPEFVAIFNLTTDSFSDGGKFLNADSLRLQALAQIEAGADYLEIGAESTRPRKDGDIMQAYSDQGLLPRTREFIDLEVSRLKEAFVVLNELRAQYPHVKISVDTRQPEVAQKISDFEKIDMLNDVSGFRQDLMLEVAKKYSYQLCSMHALSIPVKTGEFISEDISPAIQLNTWIKQQLEQFVKSDITKSRIIFDPGVGFGKSTAQNWFILENIDQLKTDGCPVYLGFSRKTFLQKITDRPAAERDSESALVTARLKLGNFEFLRVHDVRPHKSALAMGNEELWFNE